MFSRESAQRFGYAFALPQVSENWTVTSFSEKLIFIPGIFEREYAFKMNCALVTSVSERIYAFETEILNYHKFLKIELQVMWYTSSEMQY